jgi:adenosine kinase
VEHLKQPENMKLLEGAKVVYSAGFFITACAPAIEACADHCLQHKKTYALVCALWMKLCGDGAVILP